MFVVLRIFMNKVEEIDKIIKKTLTDVKNIWPVPDLT